ncbi:MAG: transpeptidase family protein [Tannerellaceae bacterium]|jgi:cell division protein FtsI (penicillin-binding protein 3)|nr:transpeptidase family protein [Tannerellaceae bacterium]
MAEKDEIREAEQRGSQALLRYVVVILLLMLVAGGVVFRTIRTAFVDHEEWKKIAEKQKHSDKLVYPSRGNIYSSDGRLMATSVPRYYTYIDFNTEWFKLDSTSKPKVNGTDTFLMSKTNGVDSLAYYLAKNPGGKTAAEYKAYLMKGLKSKSRQYAVYGPKVSYSQLKEMRTYPFFRLGRNKSGFYAREMVERQRPFGSLASRTIGDVFGEIDSTGVTKGRSGLEMQYDSLLRGVPGLNAVRRVNGAWTNIAKVEPVAGMDVRSTIDIEIQDITEKSLVDMLRSTDAESGTAIVMEVETGEVKAITNMARKRTGVYDEKTKNHAISDMLEPGSTFKVASIMVALEDGKCQPSDLVDTGNGVYPYAGQKIRDHNWHRGGYGVITVEEAIWFSSNIGVAKTIINGYATQPEKFVEGIQRLGLTEDLRIEIPGAGYSVIRMPDKTKSNWSATALPWMSFGYETQIPPIYTLNFFNAIANDGKMLRPIFVKEIAKNGEVVHRFSTEVVKSSICSDRTLRIIQGMLEGVVEKGTGKPAHSNAIRIAGKTGTAQIAEGGSYQGSGHQVSFAGYFPADNPEFSCMVLIRRPRIGYPSGGTMSGAVVKSIAEKISANRMRYDIREVEVDSLAVPVPTPKAGNMQALRQVLRKLDIKATPNHIKSPWALAKANDDRIELDNINVRQGLVPHVVGMGAKDAVYLLEDAGLKVELTGLGRVVRQSVQSGAQAQKGQTITITLQ